MEIYTAVLAAASAVIVALIGLWGARKLGIGESQEQLVATLKDLVEAQNKKIAVLEATALFDKGRIGVLEKRVDELEELTVRQAQVIDNLTRQKGVP